MSAPLPPLHLGTRETVLRALATAIVVFAFAALVVETVRYGIYGGERVPRGGTIMGLFDVDHEDSLPTWFQGLQLAFAGLLSLAWGRTDPRPLRWGWLVVGILFLAMSLDEVISLHERLIAPLRDMLAIDSGPLFFAWVIPGLLFALAFALTMIPFLRRLPRATAVRLIVAGAVFVAGAAGMEMIGGTVAGSIGQHNLTYRLVVITEETLEMVGTFLAIRALLLHFSHSRMTAPQELDGSSAR